MVQERYKTGEQEYGHLTWLTADTVDMAIEELADIVNYAAFTAVKLKILKLRMQHAAEQLGGVNEGDDMVTIQLGDIDRIGGLRG
jgi:hypothetical protein